MTVAYGSQLQKSLPPALDVLLVNRGVLVPIGLGWFGGVMKRKAQNKHLEPPLRIAADEDLGVLAPRKCFETRLLTKYRK